MDAWNTINRIGARLGVRSALRWKWRQRGVPYKWQLSIVEEAKKDGIVLDFATLRRFAGHSRRHRRAR